MNRLVVVVVAILTGAGAVGIRYETTSVAGTTYCPMVDTDDTLNMTRSRNYYECPGNFPPEYSECCQLNRCCTISIYKQLDQRVSYLIAGSCFLFSIIFMLTFCLCSIWRWCPLFTLCHSKLHNQFERAEERKLFDIPPYQPPPSMLQPQQQEQLISSDDSVGTVPITDCLLLSETATANRYLIRPIPQATFVKYANNQHHRGVLEEMV